MKNCPKCGHQNPDDAKFCETCGTALPNGVPISSSGNTSSSITQGTKIGLGVLSFLIPIAGIILGVMYMNKADADEKQAGKLFLYLGIGGFVLACLIYAAGGGGY